MICLKFHLARRLRSGSPGPEARGAAKSIESYRTKLEHSLCRCYMWITGAVARDRGECDAVERIGSKDQGGESLTTVIWSVESGDGGKCEQGDPDRKSWQGSGNPAHPGRAAD